MHGRALRDGGGSSAALSFFAGVDESVQLCLPRDPDRQADRPARRARRWSARSPRLRTDALDRRAGLPDRHRHRPLQADQRCHRLQPRATNSSAPSRERCAEACAGRHGRSAGSARANSPSSIPMKAGRSALDLFVERTDRAADGALPAADPSAVDQSVGRHRRDAQGWRRAGHGCCAAPIWRCSTPARSGIGDWAVFRSRAWARSPTTASGSSPSCTSPSSAATFISTTSRSSTS